MSCPITAVYLRGVRKNFSGLDRRLYEDEFESLGEVEDHCRDMMLNDTDQRLRAFFCIEIMVKVVPNVLRTTLNEEYAENQFIVEFDNYSYGRSWEGLTELIDAIDTFEREVVMEGEETRALYGKRTGETVARMVVDSLDRSEGHLVLVKRAAEVLRRDLRDPINEVHKVGGILAEFLTSVSTAPATQLDIGRQMLEINIHTVKA